MSYFNQHIQSPLGCVDVARKLPINLNMKNNTPPRDERIATAVAQVVDGPSEEKVKGISALGSLLGRPDLIRNACLSKSARMRAAGALALGNFGEHTDRLTLEQLASDENSYVRTAACQGLGVGGFSKSYLLLTAIVEDEQEGNAVRGNALIAAARLIAAQLIAAQARAIPPQALAQSEQSKHQHQQLEKQESQVLQLAQGLCDVQVLRYEGYVRTLGALGSRAAMVRLEDLAETALQTGLQNPKDACHLLNALGRKPLTERGQAIMTQALDSLPGGRTEAARSLAQWPSELARHALERVLSDKNPQLARFAIMALCSLGITPSLEAIKPLLKFDDANALDVIINLRGPDSFDFCHEIAANGKPGQRVAALKKLMALSPDKALEAFKVFAGDANPQVRYAALQLLITCSGDALLWRSKAKEDAAPWVAELATDCESNEADHEERLDAPLEAPPSA